MKLYLITRTDEFSYDAYDSAVVVARSPKRARTMHPCDTPQEKYRPLYPGYDWPMNPERVTVKYLGEASPTLKEGEVVCASFNAG